MDQINQMLWFTFHSPALTLKNAQSVFKCPTL